MGFDNTWYLSVLAIYSFVYPDSSLLGLEIEPLLTSSDRTTRHLWSNAPAAPLYRAYHSRSSLPHPSGSCATFSSRYVLFSIEILHRWSLTHVLLQSVQGAQGAISDKILRYSRSIVGTPSLDVAFINSIPFIASFSPMPIWWYICHIGHHRGIA